MPWIRKGREVFNQSTGASKGKSASVEMANRHLRALYANAKPSEKRHHKKPSRGRTGDGSASFSITDDYS